MFALIILPSSLIFSQIQTEEYKSGVFRIWKSESQIIVANMKLNRPKGELEYSLSSVRYSSFLWVLCQCCKLASVLLGIHRIMENGSFAFNLPLFFFVCDLTFLGYFVEDSLELIVQLMFTGYYAPLSSNIYSLSLWYSDYSIFLDMHPCVNTFLPKKNIFSSLFLFHWMC